MKNVCVTGSLGFLGSHLIRYLVEEDGGFNIIATSRPSLRGLPDYCGKVEWRIGDLCSYGFCKELASETDTLIHCAHSCYPSTSGESLSKDVRENIVPTMNLLEAIRESGRKPHVVFISSAGAIYGHKKGQELITEEDICEPTSSYGIQKLCLENYLRLWSLKGYIQCTVLRVTNVYGAILSPSRKQGLIGIAVGNLMTGQPISIFGNLENVRDYVHINDVLQAIRKTFEPSWSFEVFNIGTGIGTSVKEVIIYIEDILNKKVKLVYLPENHLHEMPKWNVVSCKKASAILDWKHQIDLKAGIKIVAQTPFES